MEHSVIDILRDYERLPKSFNIDTNGIFNFEYEEATPQSYPTEVDATSARKGTGSHAFVPETGNSTFLETYQLPTQNMESNFPKRAIGIDLGTSRCFLAVGRKDRCETVGIDNTGERSLPSYVAFDEEHDKCGQIVVNRLANHASSTVFDVKRFIGKPFEYIAQDPTWPFKILERDNKVFIETQKRGRIIQKSPPEISVVLLRHLKKKAEEFQGQSLSEAVITVPAAFSLTQREATQEAATLAGWETVHLLPEPIAAAFAYFSTKSMPTDSVYLLVDFGGGTLDVCLFRIEQNGIHIINCTGDTCLGGRNFDNSLFHYFEGILEKKYGIQVCSDNKRKYCLLQQCMDIKHTLSVQSEDSWVLTLRIHFLIIDFRLCVGDFDPSSDDFIKITSEKLEEITKQLLLNIKTTIIKALSDEGYHVNQVNKVLQVGGGCRMPMIKELLRTMFPDAEPCIDNFPDELIAIGAAYYAVHLINQRINQDN